MTSRGRFYFHLFAAIAVTLSQAMDYRDLEAFGITCPGTDSCSTIPNDSSFFERNCECDSECIVYKDCCIDVSQPRNARTHLYISCMEYGDSDKGVYAVSRCPSSFNGDPELRYMCQSKPHNISDPLMSAPVTDMVNSITYSSRYCAECNDANVDSLHSWELMVYCNFTNRTPTEAEVTRNFRYHRSLNKWGAMLDNTFQECKLAYHKPPNISSTRDCRPNIVSTCPASYRFTKDKRACALYMDVVYGNGVKYRNPHCAKCNGVDISNMRCCCETVGGISGRRKSFTFSMLVDVNPSDGDKVGVRARCPSGQAYDKVFDKCRSLSCALPNYRVVNRKCVKDSS